MPIEVESCVASHVGDRPEQQDRVGLFVHPRYPDVVLAVLADGMGGLSGGAMAAEQVLLRARQNLESYAPRHETPESLLRSVLSEAHTGIRLTRFTSELEPHSTAVALLLQPEGVWWAHCGDSRAYHFRGGALMSRTRDHSIVGELLHSGVLDEAGARNHPRRSVLLSCLGDQREPRIDIAWTRPLLAGDRFLLCSDGLWAYFSDSELALALHEHAPRTAAERLLALARERASGGGDNISLAIIKLAGRSAP